MNSLMVVCVHIHFDICLPVFPNLLCSGLCLGAVFSSRLVKATVNPMYFCYCTFGKDLFPSPPTPRRWTGDSKIIVSSMKLLLLGRTVRRRFACAIVALLFTYVLAMPVFAGDWPEWGGPKRDFTVDNVSLASSWPDSGLRKLWNRTLGDGYSSIVAAGGRLYVMFCNGDLEHVAALDANTGETIWQHRYPAPFIEGTNVEEFGPGPLSTPLIVEPRIYAIGVTGILHCLDLGSGQVLWKHELIRELHGTNLFRGYSASPIGFDGSIIAPVGGPGRAVVAFAADDGSILWKKHDFAISHVSPIMIRVDDQQQLVVLGEKTIVGLDPVSGQSFWQHDHPIAGGYISSTPVWGHDGRLFFSGAYGEGSRCIHLKRTGEKTVADEIWHSARMRVHHSNVTRIGDYVYGPSGDFAAIKFMAVKIETGEVVWQDRRLGRASCLYVDGKVLALQEDGQLMLASLSPEELTIHSTAKLFDGRGWTAPTLVGNRMYVRNRKDIMAFELP